jgi:ribosome-binding factor A
MARSDGKRPDRVGERIREELMGLILRGAVHDPAVTDVVVSGVKATEDLSMARVYVRTLNPQDEAGQARVIAGLERAAGFLRREVGKALGIRLHPELRFFWDESIDRAISIERLFDEIKNEGSAPSQAASGKTSGPKRGSGGRSQ